MSTLLCVPILVEDLAPALAAADAAGRAGADLVEWRIDAVFHGEGDDDGRALVARLVDDAPLPCIISCRTADEGGLYDGDDASRIALYEWLAARERPPRYIDVELAAFQRSANLRQKVRLAVDHPGQGRGLTTSLILSLHDFEGRPADLFKRLGAMRDEPAAKVLKIAYRARSLRDNLELLELLAERDRPTIALAMGEFGLMSRVLAPKFGGFLTFASIDAGAETAPGQPTLAELLSRCRFRAIGGATRVYGVIGWPVAHSLSPAVHNAGFDAVGWDGVDLPLPVADGWEPFKATLGALLDDPRLGFAGASVTIPHKPHLLRFAREDDSRAWSIDPVAERVGAANTLVVEHGACRVLNTDVEGVLAPLEAAAGRDLSGRDAGVLGAGGAARAAAAALAGAGARVTVYARATPRADALAAWVREHAAGPADIHAAPWDDRLSTAHDLLIHCTPIGMAGGPDPDGSPLTGAAIDRLPEGAVVFDTVYTPLDTPLTRLAADAGRRVIHGGEMFVAQAAAQFRAWTNTSAPIERFRDIVLATDPIV